MCRQGTGKIGIGVKLHLTGPQRIGGGYSFADTTLTPIVLDRDRLARFGTASACLGTLLAVIMVVSGALFRAPLTNLGTEATIFRNELCVDGHRLDAQLANSRTLQAAFWTGVFALFAEHRDDIR